MFIFTPAHVQLLNACYPPTSSLLAASSGYSPNSHELSRLTYFASNHPAKLTKLGAELEKRIRPEARKARTGNLRARATLLVSLAVLRALAIECRRDIRLLSVPLMSCIDATLSMIPEDLEVVARAASVFTAWTTYTDGHLIGVDETFTKNYESVLLHFANLSHKNAKDQEVRNRTRLIGVAALTGAANSEALYHNASQFARQVSIMMMPILDMLLHASLKRLDEQATDIKESPSSPYLAEFRARPTVERRAASIHVHIDGDVGPSEAEVTNAVLHILFVLLGHVNVSQLGQVMQSTFDTLVHLDAWKEIEYCCWFAKRITEWVQYQYRYVVPTWLVERLLENQDAPATGPLPKALLLMVTAVLNAPIPLVDISSSDMLSNLVVLMLRRIAKNPKDELVPVIVSCISSLGHHVYYSDQIQDLAAEMVNRLTIVEMQGIPGTTPDNAAHGRSEALRGLLAALRGLIFTANNHDKDNDINDAGPELNGKSPKTDPQFRRTRVPPDIWHDTLSLLCDKDIAVRGDYANLLAFYLTEEMPKRGDVTNSDGVRNSRRSAAGPLLHATTMNVVLHGGDVVMKVINAIHAYLYILSLASSLGLDPNSTTSNFPSTSSSRVDITTQSDPNFLLTQQAPRLRKVSKVQKLSERVSETVSNSCSAYMDDYARVLRILTTIHEQTPVRGLFAGVPMLLALDASTKTGNTENGKTVERIFTIKEVIARVWRVLGKVWDSAELVGIADNALSSMPRITTLSVQDIDAASSHDLRQPIDFSDRNLNATAYQWAGIDSCAALRLISNCRNVQQATGLCTDVLLDRFTSKWSVDAILKDSFDKTSAFEHSIRGDGVSPLLKISPALMHDNMSLHSLARSARAVGVTDLREALEGRSSMSNPALANAPSLSTLEHISSYNVDTNLGRARSTSRGARRLPTTGSREVRDVLNRLGINKQNANLLKASFPAALQKSVQKIPPYKV
ncbi:hypothetical protein F5887DRAFT_203056 [Amanita rubescens]|nr:hypothetical protein F5887DRAFT_203056 [Amanita rubescens]